MPLALEQVILTALAKAPEQRFANAQAMSMALQHATAQLPPEQWKVITGSSAGSPSNPSGWQPSMPASWAGETRRTKAPEAKREQWSTATERQEPPVSPSGPARKRTWIGLGALLVAGAGVTAVVLTSQQDPPRLDATAAKTTAETRHPARCRLR